MPTPRPARLLALLALAAPAALSGCYAYRAEARNESAQDVRISIVKGTRQRVISTVEVPPGGHIAWEGATNGPVLLRVSRAGSVADDVELPRRINTLVEVTPGGVRVEGQEAADHPAPAAEHPAPEAEHPEAPEDNDMIDLIEDDG